MSTGDLRSAAWNARRGRSDAGLPIDPATGLAERRAGQVYMVPHNQWGAPAGWMGGDEYEDKYNTGWTWQQILAASAPWIAGGIGALAGAGGASSAIPSVSATGGIPAGTTFGAAAAPTVAGGTTAAATAAGAAKGAAGMAGFGLKDALQFGPLIASLFKGGGNEEPPQNAAMNELIGLQTQRMKQADPLYQAILQMAMALAPKYARSTMAPPPTGAAPSADRAVPRAR